MKNHMLVKNQVLTKLPTIKGDEECKRSGKTHNITYYINIAGGEWRDKRERRLYFTLSDSYSKEFSYEKN